MAGIADAASTRREHAEADGICALPSARSESDPERTLAQPRSEPLYGALRLVAPGTPLREGIDRILQAKMGALIVVGDGPEVLNICSGGFLLDAEFTPQRLSELAKMDGAIILAADGTRVARANVHLVPDPDIPTTETGTRHRTAERVARQIDVPVITVSEEMGVVSVHYRGHKRTLDAIPRVLARADQALQILGRYKARLDGVTGALSALEVEDLVTVRDVVDGAPARRDGAPHRRRDRGLRRRARRRRPARRAPARGAHRRRRRRPPARRARLLRRGRAAIARRCRRSQLAGLPDDDLLDLRTVAGLLGLSPDSISTPRSSRAATACSARSRACPTRSSTT